MKKLIPVLFVAFALYACNEENPLPEGCIEVEVKDQLCGGAVLQIKDPKYYSLGESANGYENVFYTFFHCEDPVSTGSTVFIKFTENNDKGVCARCLAIMAYDGEKNYNVRVADCL